MAVTINVFTQFGPYQAGTRLVVSVNFARNLISAYGGNVRITSTYGGTYWFQDGAVLNVYPRFGPRPPFPPRPTPTPIPQTLNVRFLTSITDPVSGQTYAAGPLYTFTLNGLQTLNSRVGGLVFSADADQDNIIPVSQLSRWIGRTVYVDQAIYAFRGRNFNNGNADDNGIPNAFNANARNMANALSTFR